MLYLMNSPVLTDYGLWRFSGPLDPSVARSLIDDQAVSAIGHEASARLLSQILDMNVQTNRQRVTMGPGDRALVLRVLERLPAGVVLSDQALRAIPTELALLERIE